MKVKEVLETKKRSGDPIGIKVSDAISDAIKIMVENDMGSCVIFDDAHKFKGIVTFREVLAKLNDDPTAVSTKIEEIMDADPKIATPEDTVDQVRKIMTGSHIRYLPIMDKGKLTDILSFYDVARAVAKETDIENRMLKQYINDWPE